MFELLKLAGFKRTKACCEGVELKVCNTDEWQGNMDSLFFHVQKNCDATAALREVVEEYSKYFKVTNGIELLDLSDEEAVASMSSHALKIRKAALVLKELDNIQASAG